MLRKADFENEELDQIRTFYYSFRLRFLLYLRASPTLLLTFRMSHHELALISAAA